MSASVREYHIIKVEAHSTYGPTQERYYHCVFDDGTRTKYIRSEIEQHYACALTILDSYDALHGDDEASEVQWELERIKRYDACTGQYKVKWKAFRGEQYPDTWEPFENIAECSELLKGFEQRQKRKRREERIAARKRARRKRRKGRRRRHGYDDKESNRKAHSSSKYHSSAKSSKRESAKRETNYKTLDKATSRMHRVAAREFLESELRKSGLRKEMVASVLQRETQAFDSANGGFDAYTWKCARIAVSLSSATASPKAKAEVNAMCHKVRDALRRNWQRTDESESSEESHSDSASAFEPPSDGYSEDDSELEIFDHFVSDQTSDSDSQQITGRKRRMRRKVRSKKANDKRAVSVLSLDSTKSSDSDPILEIASETDSSEDAPICQRKVATTTATKKKVAMAKKTTVKDKSVQSAATRRPFEFGSANVRKRKGAAVALSRGAVAAKRRRPNEAVPMRRTEDRRTRAQILAQRTSAIERKRSEESAEAKRTRIVAEASGLRMRDGVLVVRKVGAGDGLSHTRAATSKTNAQFRAGARALIAAKPVTASMPTRASATVLRPTVSRSTTPCNGPLIVRIPAVTSRSPPSQLPVVVLKKKVVSATSVEVINLGIVGETVGGLCEKKLSPPPLESPETDSVQTLIDTKPVSRMCDSVVNPSLRSSPALQASKPVHVIGQELVAQRQDHIDLGERVSISRRDEEWTVFEGLLEVHKDAPCPPPTDPRTRGRSLTRRYVKKLGSTPEN